MLRQIQANGDYYRVGLNLDYSSNSETEASDLLIGLNGGLEKHLTGTERLSPYYGAGAGVNLRTLKDEDTEGALTNSGSRGYLQLQLKGFAGADYYIAQNLYLGVELGYGLFYTSYAKVRDTENDVTVVKASNSIFFGKSVETKLRLGFCF
jgi:hypothetical protein